jgi:hypothetical protein
MTYGKRITIVASLVVLAYLATSARAADPNGTWKWKFTRQDGQEMELAVKLKAEGEKLTGQLILPMGDKIDIEKGTFKDDEVKFETTFERNGMAFKTKYKGKVEGDMIKGKSERERNGEVVERDWEPKREKP